MLKKTRSAQTGKAKVTFVLSSEPNADHIHVAGDFNDWQASTPMKRQKDGTFRATVELEPGREYQFRYLVDGNNWVNDEAADAYYPNPFGADNSVVRTPDVEGDRPGSTGGSAGGRTRSGGARGASARGDAGRSGGAMAAGSARKGSSGGRTGSGRSARPGSSAEPASGGKGAAESRGDSAREAPGSSSRSSRGKRREE